MRHQVAAARADDAADSQTEGNDNDDDNDDDDAAGVHAAAPRTARNVRPKLSDYGDFVRPVIDFAQEWYRYLISTQNAFPGPSSRCGD